MVLFNYATKEITAKIVYYGPGLCGKTTNLQFVYDSLPSNNKSKMLSLATKQDRTLFFDFLPLDLGKIRGMRTKLQLYTVPGQVYYNSTRQLVLKGADGVVFVADSQEGALDANLESWQNLEDNLKKQGIRINEIPIVMQYNKRDLPTAMPVRELDAAINRLRTPSFESVATTGIGVEETLRGITQGVLDSLVKKYGLHGAESVEREIQPLNPKVPAAEPHSVWTEDNVLAAEMLEDEGDLFTEPPASRDGFVMEDDRGENLPTIPTELVESASPFEDLLETSAPRIATTYPSVEIDISDLGLETGPQGRRSADVPFKDITVPVSISLKELQTHKRLRLRIQLDLTLLP
jgi:signal recognition particle receptor subunit beta